MLLPATAAQQITVAANRTGVRVVENATSVTILSSPDLDATAAFRVDDILRQVPGFSLFRRTTSRTANPTTQGVSLRGLGASGASRALVLDDGFPLNDPFGGWVYWDRTPRVSIDRIEVASGGASHLYGSDALGGVINILRAPVDRNALSLEVAGGNENTPDVSLAASRKMGPWAFGLTSELFRTDGYIAVPADLRGAVDTPVNSQNAMGDVTIQRQFGDRGSRLRSRVGIRRVAEQRHAPADQQYNHSRNRPWRQLGWARPGLLRAARVCQPAAPRSVVLLDKLGPQQREPDPHPERSRTGCRFLRAMGTHAGNAPAPGGGAGRIEHTRPNQ